jgi:hypothetical protein
VQKTASLTMHPDEDNPKSSKMASSAKSSATTLKI